mgnify:CR=1 FL=1
MENGDFLTNVEESFLRSFGPFIENSSDSSCKGSQTYEALIIGQSELVSENT